jgi:hypothetical protein
MWWCCGLETSDTQHTTKGLLFLEARGKCVVHEFSAQYDNKDGLQLLQLNKAIEDGALAVWHVVGSDLRNAAYKHANARRLSGLILAGCLRVVVEVVRKGTTVPPSRPGSGGRRTKGPRHHTTPNNSRGNPCTAFHNNAMMVSIAADLKTN